MHKGGVPNCCLLFVLMLLLHWDRIYIVGDREEQRDILDKAIVLRGYMELHNILLLVEF